MNHVRRSLLPTAACLLALLLPVGASAATGDPTARLAADRTARDLAANGHVLPAGGDDLGMTLDAIVLFAATGTNGDAARSAVAAVLARQHEYLATAGTGNEGRRAKLAYVLQVAGGDASSHVAALRAGMSADGSFGSGAWVTPFSQSYAVLALARTAEGVPAASVERLVAMQCTSSGSANHGGFGFSSDGCRTADGDATGMAVSALLAAGRPASDPVITRAAGWLERRQLADGSFGASLASRSGNANSTGLAALAARQVGTPAALAVANAAASYVRELQVTCASPIIAGDDPSIGGGFPRTWVGAIAYDAAAQEAAITNGIRSGQLTQWRVATLQAALAMPGVTGLGAATLAAAEPATGTLPTCPIVSAPQPTGGDASGGTGGGVGASLPAARLRVATVRRPVAVGARTLVTVRGLAPRERWTMLLSGRVVARGVASTRGTVRVRVVIPRRFGSHPARVLRVLGSTTRRAGTARVATAAPRRLVTPLRQGARPKAMVRIVVRGLLPREPWRATVAGRRVAAGIATRSGIAIVRLRAGQRAGTQRVLVCATTCTRRAVVQLRVRA